jgi:hypothetical protein
MKICITGNDWKQQFPLIKYGRIESAVEHLCQGIKDNHSDIQFDVIVPKIIEKKNKL